MSAGVVGGVHCVGMCGGIAKLLMHARPNSAESLSHNQKIITIHANVAVLNTLAPVGSEWRFQIALHAGRLLTYALAGAILGGVGTAGLLFKPYLPVHQILFVVGNLALMLLGLRLMGWVPHIDVLQTLAGRLAGFAHYLTAKVRVATRHPLLLGMAWGCLPCGLLFAVAPFALLAGDPGSGAAIMLLFGLSALPHLLLAQKLMCVQRGRFGQVFTMLAAIVLLMMGGFGLLHANRQSMPDFLCVTSSR